MKHERVLILTDTPASLRRRTLTGVAEFVDVIDAVIKEQNTAAKLVSAENDACDVGNLPDTTVFQENGDPQQDEGVPYAN